MTFGLNVHSNQLHQLKFIKNGSQKAKRYTGE